MDMRKDIVRTRNRKEEGTSNSAKARRRLRETLLSKGAFTKVELDACSTDIVSKYWINSDKLSDRILYFVNNVEHIDVSFVALGLANSAAAHCPGPGGTNHTPARVKFISESYCLIKL